MDKYQEELLEWATNPGCAKYIALNIDGYTNFAFIMSYSEVFKWLATEVEKADLFA